MGAGPDIDLDLLHFNSPTEDSGLTVSHPHCVIFATTLCNQAALHTPVCLLEWTLMLTIMTFSNNTPM